MVTEHSGPVARCEGFSKLSMQRMTQKLARNKPCPCGSGKKFKKCCLGKRERKMTLRWNIDSGPWPNHLRFYPDGKIALYSDDTLIAPTTASIETHYERPSKRKVLNRVSVSSPTLSHNLNDVITQFSSLVAIDTNTRVINNRRISASGIVTADIELDDGACRLLLRRSLLEIRGLPEHDEEQYAWHILFRILANDPQFRDQARIGVIVDSNADRIDAMNHRDVHVWPGCFVPSNAQLLYATSDAGTEYFPNMMIRDCDTLASQLLEHLEASGLAEQEGHLRPYDDGVLITHWTADDSSG